QGFRYVRRNIGSGHCRDRYLWIAVRIAPALSPPRLWWAALEYRQSSDGAGCTIAYGIADGLVDLRVHLPARPQHAGRRLHCRPDHRSCIDPAIYFPWRDLGGATPTFQLPRHRRARRADRGVNGHRQLAVRLSVSDLGVRSLPSSLYWRVRLGYGHAVRSGRISGRSRRHPANPVQYGPRQSGRVMQGDPLMEAVLAITLGIMMASGVYLLLRARVFPVVMGLTLISYAVNLFIFAMGRLTTG